MTTLLEKAVVRIYSNQGRVIGAGFLFSQKHILTCAHVVAFALGIPVNTSEMSTAEVSFDFPRVARGKKLTAKLVRWIPVNPNESVEDIAVLESVSSLPEEAQAVYLFTDEDLKGHPFQVFGFPKYHSDGVWASGKLYGATGKGWVQLEALKETGYALEEGFSGAPVWDEKLNGVVGMAVAAEKQRPNVRAGFIIPTTLLVKALRELVPCTPCPYRGLSAFGEEDAKFFFGREKFTSKLVAAVQKPSLVAVVGASGSGKSSVVFAGLIPRLRAQANWQIVNFRPADRPLNTLADALLPLLEPQLNKTHRQQKRELVAEFWQNNGLREVVEDIIYTNPGIHLLLLVDQFEELYTLCREQKNRLCFLDRLLEAVPYTPNFNVVITLRADFFEHVLSYRPLADALEYADLKLGPMNRQELRKAIEKPAKLCGVKLEPGLTELILDSVSEEPGNLPLLEFALTQLWQERSNGKLKHAAYGAMGGVAKALASYAQQEYDNLPNRQERLAAKNMFLELTQLGEDTADTRRQVEKKDLVELLQKSVQIQFEKQARDQVPEQQSKALANRVALAERVIQEMANAKLVVTRELEKDGERVAVVDVAHEALIRHWPLLSQWLKEEREALRVKREIEVAAQKWDAQDKYKRSAFLLRGTRLTQAKEFLQSHGNTMALLDVAKEFIKASQRAHKVAQITIFSIVTIFIMIAGKFWQQRVEQRMQRLREAVLVDQVSRDLLPVFPDLLQRANRRVKKEKIEEALSDYRSVLTGASNIKEKNRGEFQKHDLEKIEEYAVEAENSLVSIIREHHLPILRKELKNREFGLLKLNAETTQFEQQFTPGALHTTYKIIMQDFGIGADLNKSGSIENDKEAQRIPQKIVEDIEKLWRQYTDEQCGWFGSESFTRELGCHKICWDKVCGKTLTLIIFPDDRIYPITRICSFKEVRKPANSKCDEV